MAETLFETLAKESDPWTSDAAAEEVKRSGRFDSQKKAVLMALKDKNGLTSAELANRMGVSRYVTARRLPDLEREGLVVQGPVRECRATRRKCVTWFSKDMFGPGEN